MPVPVMGAILIFVTSFMVLSGIQIMLASKIDSQKIFVIGIAFVFGLSLDILPGLYAGITGWLRPLFSSSTLTPCTFWIVESTPASTESIMCASPVRSTVSRSSRRRRRR